MQTTISKSAIFQHNRDLSGEVVIVSKITGAQISLPFKELKSFIAEYVRNEKISRLEQENEDKILGL